MNRRSFFGALVGLFGLGAVGRAAGKIDFIGPMARDRVPVTVGKVVTACTLTAKPVIHEGGKAQAVTLVVKGYDSERVYVEMYETEGRLLETGDKIVAWERTVWAEKDQPNRGQASDREFAYNHLGPFPFCLKWTAVFEERPDCE